MEKMQITKKQDKLVVVTRQDLPIGYQAVQSGHALADFILQHPQIAEHWHKTSNYLVFLSTHDEESLEKLIIKAQNRGIKYTPFYEPDVNNQLTSVAFEPSDETRKLVSNIPLLGKEYNTINIKSI